VLGLRPGAAGDPLGRRAGGLIAPLRAAPGSLRKLPLMEMAPAADTGRYGTRFHDFHDLVGRQLAAPGGGAFGGTATARVPEHVA
jgi:hypothetical protein